MINEIHQIIEAYLCATTLHRHNWKMIHGRILMAEKQQGFMRYRSTNTPDSGKSETVLHPSLYVQCRSSRRDVSEMSKEK